MSRSFPRLHVYTIEAPTDEEEIAFLVKRLQAGDELTRDQRRAAARYLRLLASKGGDILRQRYPRRAQPEDVALDFAATVRRKGGKRGLAHHALKEVGDAWDLEPATVKDYWKDYRVAALYQLGELLSEHVGERGSTLKPDGTRVPIIRTEQEVLEAISLDLRDRRQSGRKK